MIAATANRILLGLMAKIRKACGFAKSGKQTYAPFFVNAQK